MDAPLDPAPTIAKTSVTLGAARGAVPETEVAVCTGQPPDAAIGDLVVVPSGARVTVQVALIVQIFRGLASTT